MALVALLTFSDGRDFVFRELDPFTSRVEDDIAGRLRAGGHEVLREVNPALALRRYAVVPRG